jgi:hypothetical protein
MLRFALIILAQPARLSYAIFLIPTGVSGKQEGDNHATTVCDFI